MMASTSRKLKAADGAIRTPEDGDNVQPLYLSVAKELLSGIELGQWPVGTLLPTEMQLADSFQVSRQTIRKAIAYLRDLRLVSATKHVGTRVEARSSHRAYHHSLQSLPDMFQFATDAVFRVHSSQIIKARGKLARALACRAGQEWLRLDGVRTVAGDPLPVSWTSVHVDGRFSTALQEISVHTSPIFKVIEQMSGDTIVSVRQDIAAIHLPREVAEVVQANEGAPALMITRRFQGVAGKVLQMSVNIHPADRFTYSMTIERHD